ncbi:hypothetical protein [Brevundimonas pondensis]|uniref:Uncharacterized protein n=1 Tax=Brevundimonas pondensis TaxID=2774189 RepID=A0ABX7SLF0_9CAUL|nr:hypothetical protein [Brevundimonas pondensis]QTC88169.1 hypothetical protein IFE19_01820 [Brevundimonas pondensis]
MTRASDVGADHVARLRGRNLGWAAIARMTGASEVDLKRLYGGLAVDPVAPPPMDGATAAGRVRSALIAAGMDQPSARIIARLWRANGGRMTAAQLTLGLMTISVSGGGDSDADRVRRVQAARRAAQAMGVEFQGAGRGTGLTVKGLARLSEMAGLKPDLDVAA